MKPYSDGDFERMKGDALFTRQYFWSVCMRSGLHETWRAIQNMSDDELMRFAHDTKGKGDD